MVDRAKSLEQLDGKVWPEPDFQSSLVLGCHKARKKPLRDLTITDLSRLIREDICTPLLIEEALLRLEEDPLVDGDFFEGELLITLAHASGRDSLAPHRAVILSIIKGALQRADVDRLDSDLQKELQTYVS
jgi:hypothetical protein